MGDLAQKAQVLTLLDKVTANSSGPVCEWSGGNGTVQVYGTFDTCTVTIYGSLDGETWTTFSDFTPVTAAYCGNIDMQGNMFFKAVVSSVGGSTSVSAKISPAIPR